MTTSSSASETAAPSDEPVFAQVREDPAIEAAVVERLARDLKRPLKVLLVASGGCTALSLLALPAVGRVDAIDANPAQLHLVALRMEAIVRLPLADQLLLFGGRPEGTEEQRMRLYEVVRDYLPPATRAYWDARPALIGAGINRVGRFEALCRDLAAAFAERGLDPVARPAEAITHKAWPGVFEQVFSTERLAAALGPHAVAYAASPAAPRLADAFARAMLRHAPRDNYFLHQALCDAYPPGDASLPKYLQGAAQSAMMVQGLHRLRLHEGRIEARLPELAAAHGPYDLIQTSDVTDWMPHAALRTLFAAAADALAPGGAVLARRLNGDYDLADELGRWLTVDARFSRQWQERDRSFLYREVVLGIK